LVSVAGKESEPLARKLGAHVYIDSSATNAAEELKKLGGARLILSTAPSGKAMASLVDGLSANGRMLVIGAGPGSHRSTNRHHDLRQQRTEGLGFRHRPDSEDTLRFAAYTGVRAMIEKYPLDKVNEAYNRMTSGKAQFRVVLTM
jgi:D-arabinose 1-dehydrogenase-like Zn-dependent alcohol dehydrogenase